MFKMDYNVLEMKPSEIVERGRNSILQNQHVVLLISSYYYFGNNTTILSLNYVAQTRIKEP